MLWDDDLLEELTVRRARGLERRPPILESAVGPRAVINGREVLAFASNDYLGLAHHPSVTEAAIRAAKQCGTGVAGSRLTIGNSSLNIDLEAALSRFTGHESAIVFPSGYATNMGTVAALTTKDDLILSDALNHASVIDACRLSRADVRVYEHGDPDFAWFTLRRERENYRRALIVTNGVFSMDGDIAPLPGLCRLAEEYRAGILVDDAHAVGVLGERGRGTADHFGLIGHPALIQMGSLSKALGSVGGFVACSNAVVEVLRQMARTYGYSTGMTPSALASAWQALYLLETEPDLLQQLRTNANWVRERLRSMGFHVLGHDTPVIPVIIGDSDDTVALSEACFRRGLYVPAIRPPSVPEGSSRLRLTVSAAHTPEQLNEAVEILVGSARSLPLKWSA